MQHSVIADDKIADAEFHGAAVRQVNVRVYDNDTPGVYVTHVESPTIARPRTEAIAASQRADCMLDDRGIVIEGDADHSAHRRGPRAAREGPGCRLTITVKITMDADSQRILQILDPGLGVGPLDQGHVRAVAAPTTC